MPTTATSYRTACAPGDSWGRRRGAGRTGRGVVLRGLSSYALVADVDVVMVVSTSPGHASGAGGDRAGQSAAPQVASSMSGQATPEALLEGQATQSRARRRRSPRLPLTRASTAAARVAPSASVRCRHDPSW